MDLDDDELRATREFYERKKIEGKLALYEKWIQKNGTMKNEKKENK